MEPPTQKRSVLTVRERVQRCRAKKKGQQVESASKEKPLTPAERMKRLRAKKKESNPNYYTSELKRVEDLRKKKVMNMSPTQRKAYQKAVAVRKQKSRKNINKKLLKGNTDGGRTGVEDGDSPGYVSPQSFGKAVRRTLKALPKL